MCFSSFSLGDALDKTITTSLIGSNTSSGTTTQSTVASSYALLGSQT